MTQSEVKPKLSRRSRTNIAVIGAIIGGVIGYYASSNNLVWALVGGILGAIVATKLSE